VHLERGRAFVALKKYEDAIGSFDRVLEIEPSDPTGQFRARESALLYPKI